MQRVRLLSVAAVAFCLASAVAVTGCAGEKPKERSEARSTTSGGADEKTVSKGEAKSATSSGAKEQLASTGSGTLRGKVTFDGDPPAPADLKPVMEAQQDKSHCLKGPTTDPTWTVGPDKGLANVVVWVRAPKAKYFNVPDEEKKRPETVKMDQPFCAFEPHVFVLFPSYYDGAAKKQSATGQTFKVVNSAPISHNTNWVPHESLINQGNNIILKPHTGEQLITFKPCKDREAGGEATVDFKCDIHKWMKAFAKVFDHPFVAVTKPDGTYEIKNVPAGAEVELVYWHESMTTPKVLKKITLKEGDNPAEDFKVGK